MGHDETTINEFLARFADCWKTNDGAALAEFFAEDGTLINPFGQRANGRTAVAAMYTDYFAGLLAGTTTTVTVESIRAVGADHAFVDADEPIHGPDGRPRLVVHLTALVRRHGEEWQFVDVRPYTTAPPTE